MSAGGGGGGCWLLPPPLPLPPLHAAIDNASTGVRNLVQKLIEVLHVMSISPLSIRAKFGCKCRGTGKKVQICGDLPAFFLPMPKAEQ